MNATITPAQHQILEIAKEVITEVTSNKPYDFHAILQHPDLVGFSMSITAVPDMGGKLAHRKWIDGTLYIQITDGPNYAMALVFNPTRINNDLHKAILGVILDEYERFVTTKPDMKPERGNVADGILTPRMQDIVTLMVDETGTSRFTRSALDMAGFPKSVSF